MNSLTEGAGQLHRYRVTIEHLFTPHLDDPLYPPLVFETTNQDALMLLFIVNRLRAQLAPDADAAILEGVPRPRSTRPI